MRFALEDVAKWFLEPTRPSGPHDTLQGPHRFHPWLGQAQSGRRKQLPASSSSQSLALARLLP